MKVGVDVDGVLACWNDSFLRRLVTVSGRNLCESPSPVYPCWHWPAAFGYTPKEEAAAIASSGDHEDFWLTLNPYPNTQEDLFRLTTREALGHEIYFITNRYGKKAKQQTETWLRHCGYMSRPTVLISKYKGLCANALGLDCYIDDYGKNIDDVLTSSFSTKVFLLNRPWNSKRQVFENAITRVDSVTEMLKIMETPTSAATVPIDQSTAAGLECSPQ